MAILAEKTGYAFPLNHVKLYMFRGCGLPIDGWMSEWVLKARQNILPMCLLYEEMSDNKWATANNNNKVNGMYFSSPYN